MTIPTLDRVGLDILRHDLRYALRALRRTPGFTLTAIAVIALGVGATTAAFTMADHVLIRPLPFPEPDRLVTIREGLVRRAAASRGIQSTNDASPSNYFSWRELTTSFELMGAYRQVSLNLLGAGEPERLDGISLSYEAMQLVGMRPALGRPLTSADDAFGAPCAVLISDGLWRRRFGADAAAIGRTVVLEDESCVIAGVMPRGFDFPSRTAMLWRAIRFAPDAADTRNDRSHRVLARLKPGVSREQAAADLSAVSATIARMYPAENSEIVAVMMELRADVGAQSRMLLIALAAASACVLLIACTNLASLLIARASERGRELTVRMAVGADRSRLVRQLLTESVLLALVGGGLGFAVALAALPTAVALVPTVLPISEVPSIDWRMMLVAAAVTLGTAIAFGVLPAFRAANEAVAPGLRDGNRAGSSRKTQRLRAGLVVAQIGLSVVLLACTGLLIRALIRVQSISPGFNVENVLTMRTMLPFSKYGMQAPRVDFVRGVVEATAALPGVTGAAYTSYLPMTMRGGVWPVVVPGRPESTASLDNASARYITPDYFRVMEIPLKAGRRFEESDSMEAQPVAIVSEEFVRTYFGGSDPISRTFRFGPAGERTIVGVVGEVRVRGLERRSEPQVYLPYQQQRDNTTLGYIPKDLVVRLDSRHASTGDMGIITAAVRRIVANIDPTQPIADIQPLTTIVEGETTARATQVQVLGAFATLAGLLAAIGLHGLLAFIVSSRSREFGVRLALGAEPRSILTGVARRGLVLGVTGAAAGIVVAYGAGRWMESLLAGVNPADAITMTIAIGVSIGMTVAGSMVPAIRAARTDPIVAMKME